MRLKRAALLIPALLLAVVAWAPSPANAYCVMVVGLDGCHNPCTLAATAYRTATGRPAPFVCPM